MVTHLVVTLIIGLGPTTIAASYDAMREMEAFAEETAVELDKTVTGPIASETIECSKTITGPTIRFPLWLTMYGLIGSLLIICGTTFVAIALLKGTKDNERV